MTPPTESVADSLLKENRQKQKRISGSLWPRARLIGEILYRQIDRDQIFTQASALTYKTLFSLLPIFVLSLLILSTLSARDGKNALDSAVKNMLFEQMGVHHLAVPTTAPTTSTSPDEAPATSPSINLEAVIDPFIEKAKESVTNKTTGLIAFAILLYGAISLMIVIEGTFNQIYGSVKPRSWPRRIMLYWCVLTLGPIGVAGSIALGNSALSAANTVAGVAPSVIAAATFLSILRVLSGFFVSWLLILLLFKIVPETRVQWHAAALGSFLAALAWEIGKWAFGLYVQHAARNSYYGSMALLPLFMFWIYITWSVVLIGLEITYIRQYWALLKRQFFFARATPPGAPVISDLRWVVSLGILVYRNFKGGKVTEIDHAANTLLLPNDIIYLLLEALEKAGLVHEVRPGAYTLARPADTITAHDLLTAARALCEVPPELTKEGPILATAPGVMELEALETTWSRGQTLPMLSGDIA